MRLFGKKKEDKSCCCAGDCTPEVMNVAEEAKAERGIKILGSGCAKCINLENSVKVAVQELGLDFEIEHVDDFAKIASYGVMSTPALVINGKVVSYGKMLSVEEAKKIIERNM